MKSSMYGVREKGGSNNKTIPIVLEHLFQCVRAYPAMPEAHYSLARAYQALGSSLDACQALDQCLQLNPQHNAAKALLDETWKDTIPVPETVRQLGTWQANKEAAVQALKEDKIELALTYFKTAVGSDFQTRPTCETQGMLCSIAGIYLTLGNAEAARKAAKQVRMSSYHSCIFYVAICMAVTHLTVCAFIFS